MFLIRLVYESTKIEKREELYIKWHKPILKFAENVSGNRSFYFRIDSHSEYLRQYLHRFYLFNLFVIFHQIKNHSVQQFHTCFFVWSYVMVVF